MINLEPHPTDPDKLIIKTQKYHIAKYTEEELQAAVLAEREACSEVCESMRPSKQEYDQRFYTACTLCANAIRARGE